MRLGIDVGGTFTDVIGVDEDGRVTVRKARTTPRDPSEGVAEGIDKILRAAGASRDAVRLLVHGTTIATNALLERKGARIGLLTTAGFRDVLEIGRVQRPAEGLYDFTADNPEPLVPRALRLEALERVGSRGEVVVPLEEASVRAAAEVFRRENVRAVAVCFLFSFLRPDHERRAREILERALPGVYLSISSEVAPEFREFERTSTVVLSAYVQPIVESYVDRLSVRVREVLPRADLRLIQASGGAMRASAAKGRAVNLLNSGPAGGGTAAAYLARTIGDPRVVSVDMGGTSFDISLIAEGETRVTTDRSFEGFPLKIPMEDVSVIGAGGGSIAWIDRGGALQVGPQSAAAEPGPAAYGRGGEEATVTDANVVLGRINPKYFLGGDIQLRGDLAEAAVRRRVGEPLGLSTEEAAHGVVRVINAKMAKGIAARTVQRGYDLRDFSLVAFGGAGPLHAADLVDELGMRRAIVPPHPGAFSALGLLVADVRHDFARTIMKGGEGLDPKALTEEFLALERSGVAELEADGVPPAERRVVWSADLRFEGQSYELNVPVARRVPLGADAIRDMLRAFADLHERIYAFRAVDEKTVLVNVRVTALGATPPVPFAAPAGGKGAPKERRKVYFGGVGFVDAAIHERRDLRPGGAIDGPAVVEEEISCTVVPPGWTLRADPVGCMLLEKR